MRTIKDGRGRTWNVEMSLLAARRMEQADWSLIRKEPVHILDQSKVDEDFFTGILTNTAALFFMLWIMVMDQAEEKGISEDDFCASMTGQVIPDVKKAIWGEIADFFPEHRTILSRLADEYVRVQGKMIQAAEEMFPKLGQESDRIVEEKIEELKQSFNQTDGPGATSG